VPASSAAIGNWFVLIIPLLIVGWFLLLFFVALLEKNPVESFESTPLITIPDTVPRYLTAMNIGAANFGFLTTGMYRHVKGGMYQLFASYWFSPDRYILIQMVAGRVAKMQRLETTLISQTADGRYLVTKDEHDAGNFCDIVLLKRLKNASFEQLLQTHVKRMMSFPGGVRPFGEATPTEARQMYTRRTIQRMIDRRVARWLDDSHTTWSYSAMGALMICTVGIFGQAAGALVTPWRQYRRRPGANVIPSFPVLPAYSAPPGTRPPPIPSR
jgi:hypothetical protein